MSIPELFQEVSGSGVSDFGQVVRCCSAAGPFCLIGGLALNSYVEPVYTMDADFVLAHGLAPKVITELQGKGFVTADHPHSLNALMPGSQLRIQFTLDPRYSE
ncbi:MAG TPA: hypothetical protein VK633_14070, partial [Verrucomicrobiae bacterium]|nr:hypothetical protein [Verrucomicrobiae bacterium]